MKLNGKTQVILVITAVVVALGIAWLRHPSETAVDQAPVRTDAPLAVSLNGVDVQPAKPVEAPAGKPEMLALSNKSAGPVQVTIPGLHDDPVTVNTGDTGQLDFTPAQAGTYTIMEQGTETNTRSVEGGTIPYDMEVGTIIVGSE